MIIFFSLQQKIEFQNIKAKLKAFHALFAKAYFETASLFFKHCFVILLILAKKKRKHLSKGMKFILHHGSDTINYFLCEVVIVVTNIMQHISLHFQPFLQPFTNFFFF